MLTKKMGIKKISFWIAVLYLFGVYTGANIYRGGGLLVPSFIAGIGGFLLLAKNWRYARLQQIQIIAAVAMVVCLNLVFREADALFMERLKGWFQLVYSLLIGYGFYLEVYRWDKKDIAKLFFYFSIAIIVGCVFERFTPLKGVSDSFRSTFLHAGVASHHLVRDLAIFGSERPRLFTGEPSLVANFLLFSIAMFLALAEEKKKYLKAILLSIMGLSLIGSPILLLIAPIVFLVLVYLENRGLTRFLTIVNAKKILTIYILVTLSGGFIFYATSKVLAARLKKKDFLSESSTIIRIVAPPLIALDAVKRYPVLGTGVTAIEMIEEDIRERLLELGAFVPDKANLATYLSNSFWAHWVQFGLITGLLLFWLYYLFMRALGARHYIYCLFFILVFAQTAGVYVTPRLWIFFYGIVLTSAVATRTTNYNDARRR